MVNTMMIVVRHTDTALLTRMQRSASPCTSIVWEIPSCFVAAKKNQPILNYCDHPLVLPFKTVD